ncbi:Holliday junction branch migration protein RuvA [Corynebacterium sp. zg-331]|uniref:Holliday junction branch migration protein RuvA n=1 Tax=unclassified Corynebacterium TaxID=2624378 RepID=UPI00128B05E4|nr:MULTISPECIES: Holliday junction branch migration protein RuvA [unclassified Corynebacterium]MBC3185445.1 Holliday junction branch migration protein RuvA [Corynebacterium sp. zg-331]MPV51940.1 Holliday junction branch migration protein RuvA [Corynebacterium sp. zg331]
MIASLRGTVTSVELHGAVIECAGVGYFFRATPATLGTLRRGEEATVMTTLAVKEDSMVLYGFADAASREMFAVLQTVSGLGPRLALAAESVFGPAELAQAITGGDAKALQRIPGVGKRMAERMVVELKDKVASFAGRPVGASEDLGAGFSPAAGGHGGHVVDALMGLGFTEKQARSAVDRVLEERPDLDTAGVLRAALASLGKN